MEGKQIVAVDVGTSNVAIAVGNVEESGLITIRGIVSEPIDGINAGRLENSEMASVAIIRAKKRIESQLGIKISEAYAGISGDFIRCVQVTDMVYVQDELHNGSNQITQRDVDELDRRMNTVKLPDDSEIIIEMQPLRYKIDDREVEVPVGAYGRRLEATYNFILCNKMMYERLRQCLSRNDIKVKKVIPNAIALHHTVATTDDMQDGVVVVDFGGGVTDVSVVCGGKIRYVASIPIGANSINNDIRSMSIPSNYIEDLKIQYASAITETAIDDVIVFQASKRSPVKNVLRKNLAIVTEARLKEIAEWVRREIKDAGCGPKFAPSLLLTGGGSQMRDIEKLFARELNVLDARTVHPEYGFTEESMLEHITSPADATVASLLVYGAKSGSCTIAQRPATEVNKTPQPTGPRRPMGLSQHDQQQTTPTQPTQPTPQPEPVKPATKPEPVKPIEPEEELPKPKRRSFGQIIRDMVEKAGDKFIGDDEEGEY